MNTQKINGTDILHAASAESFILRTGTYFDGVDVVDSVPVDIEVRDGKISSVRPARSGGAEDIPVADCSGAFVMPGLIEAHVHLSGMATAEPYRRYFENPDIRLIKAMRQTEELLSRGYTTIRDMGGKGKGLSLKEAIAKGLYLGPRILAPIEYISPTGGHADWPVLPYDFVKENMLRGVIVDGVDECVQAVRYLLREKADFVKLATAAGSMAQSYDGMFFKPCFTVAEITAMCDEAHSQRKKVAAHAMGDEGIRRSLIGGVDTFEHCFYEYEKYPDILDLLLEKNAIVVPTLCLVKWFQEIEENNGRMQNAAYFDKHMEKHYAFVRTAYEAGVPIACGSDENGIFGPVGRCMEEYGHLANAGLSNVAILRGATSIAARALDIAEKTGKIAPGMSADLLVLEKSPLDRIEILQEKANVKLVVLGA